jgi:hypothetical protein
VESPFLLRGRQLGPLREGQIAPRALRAAALIAAGLLAACAASRTLTPASASDLAAKLANERCQSEFGARPFHAQDFEIRLEAGRWHWGTTDGEKVDGYEVEVSFDPEGASRAVAVRIPPE